MDEKNAINFLLYSYFGITLKSAKDEIIDRAISRAYRDATNRVFSMPIPDNEKEDLKKEAKNKINSFCKKVSGNNYDINKYDDDHRILCKTLCGCEDADKDEDFVFKKYNSDHPDNKFTYGHAQKWVNMTMKYLDVIKSIFENYNSEETNAKIKIFKKLTGGLEKKLHVPVDRYILEKVFEEYDNDKESNLLPLKKKYKDTYETYGKFRTNEKKRNIMFQNFYDNYTIKWSKWSYEEYNNFRKEFKEKFSTTSSPLDWECPAWIKISENHKNNNSY